MATLMEGEPRTRRVRWDLAGGRLAVLLWLGGLFLSSYAIAQPDDASFGEIQIKAAFLYKFTGYVEWPKSSFKDADRPITIGMVGAEEITEELRRVVSGRSVQGRGLTITVVNKDSDLSGVHVLFIGRDAAAGMTRLIEAARQRPILIVTDMPDGLERGSVINFVMVKRRVQFEISVDAAEKAGLVLSSRLLAVALRVKKGDIESEVYLAWLGEPGRARRALVEIGCSDGSAGHSRYAGQKEIGPVSLV
jgi:hypothetical protein